MNKIERYILRVLLRKYCRQGPKHDKHIEDFYREINYQCRKEFKEDNFVTLRTYLQERFHNSFINDPNDDIH